MSGAKAKVTGWLSLGASTTGLFKLSGVNTIAQYKTELEEFRTKSQQLTTDIGALLESASASLKPLPVVPIMKAQPLEAVFLKFHQISSQIAAGQQKLAQRVQDHVISPLQVGCL